MQLFTSNPSTLYDTIILIKNIDELIILCIYLHLTRVIIQGTIDPASNQNLPIILISYSVNKSCLEDYHLIPML